MKGENKRKLISPQYMGMLKRRLEKITDNGSEAKEMEFTVRISLWLLNLCPKVFVTRDRKQSSPRSQRGLGIWKGNSKQATDRLINKYSFQIEFDN